mgnify:CR=1 FL=1
MIPNNNRTKIIATVGPASNTYEILLELVKTGVNIFRFNFSHGTHEQHQKVFEHIHKINRVYRLNIGILADLQGPKIRIAKFTNKRIELKVGDTFSFSTSHPLTSGNEQVVGIDYPDLVKDCGVGMGNKGHN